MLPISRRDLKALEPLLPYIDREVTVDPEQRDPARRAARRQDVARMKALFRQKREAEEERKESELRAKLKGTESGEAPRPNSRRASDPVARPAFNARGVSQTLHAASSLPFLAAVGCVEITQSNGVSKSEASIPPAHMPQLPNVFKTEPAASTTINPPVPESSSANSGTQSCSDPSHCSQQRYCSLLHRKDFEVKRIRRKLVRGGSTVYLVRWKSTWVPSEFIIEGSNAQYSCVEADGTRWYIKKTIGRRKRHGVDQVKARWVDTREPLDMLANAQEAVDLFESGPQRSEVACILHVQRRKIITIAESNFPTGSVLPQTDEDYAASQQWVARSWPSIHPHRTLDLYPAIYRIYMEIAGSKRGKSYRSLMKLPQIRPLQWHSDYLNAQKLFKLSRRRRASLFIQVTGPQGSPCRRCSGEGKVTPFVGCVRTGPEQQSWLNGACANCGTKDNSGCDYHDCCKVRSAVRPESVSWAASNHNKHERNTCATDSEETDSSDDDEDDDSDDGDESEGEGSLWPKFPPGMPDRDFVLPDLAAVAPRPANSSPVDWNGLGTASSSQHYRAGKLPSVTNVKKRLAQATLQRSTSSSTPASAHSLPAPHHSCEPQDFQLTSSGKRSASNISGALPHSETALRSEQADGDYEPQPIEMDFLELSFKYDHLTPINPRAAGRITEDVVHTSAIALSEAKMSSERMSSGSDGTAFEPMDAHASGVIPSRLAGRKRAASTPLLHGRALQRTPCTNRNDIAGVSSTMSSPGSSVTASCTPMSTRPCGDTAVKTFLRIRTTAVLERHAVHPGCRAGMPCRDFNGKPPLPRNPGIVVYHNSLLPDRNASVEEAEYVLSQADCFWARKITVLWDEWCHYKGGIDNEKRSQVEWLLVYQDLVRIAAKECCPKEVIVIDD